MKLLKTISDLLKNSMIGGAILLAALVFNGEWLMMYWTKQDCILENDTRIAGNNTIKFLPDNFKTLWIEGMVSTYAIYFTLGLLLHYYYYKLQRDQAHEWKCQPNRWLSNEIELDAIKTSITSILVGSTFLTIVETYMSNGGYYFNVYHKWDDYSFLYLSLQVPILFILMDYTYYWTHRIFHWPILYKMFHNVHHRYRQPTVFSTTVMHPFEVIVIHTAGILPTFNPIFPICLPLLKYNLLYHYIMQILSHSGIDFKPMWWQPWQAETMFHDNHHQYFHVNFGANMKVWDWMHGTIRQEDRIYTEKIFWGKGKSIQDANQKEKVADLQERKSENEKAHPKGNKYFLFLKDGKWS